MNLEKIFYFKKVYEANSFQKASHEMGSFSSVVTRQIQKLEKDLGYTLLNRSKTGLSLTDEGEIIYKLACDMFMLKEKAMEDLNSKEEKYRGKIKILTTQGLINTWLADRMSDFLSAYPELSLDVIGVVDPIEFINIQDEVIIGPLDKDYPFLEKIFLRGYRMFLYASEAYLEKYGTPKNYEDLHNHKILAYAGGQGAAFGDVDWYMRGEKKMMQPSLNINSSIGLLKMAEKGIGIVSLGDEMVKEHKAKLVKVFPQEPGKIIDIFYIYHKKMNTLRRVRALGEYLHKKLNP